MFSVVSFNVNSIRQRMHQLQALIDARNPQVIGLQETKVTDEDFPEAAINQLGYQVYYHGQKTHYGVALLSKTELAGVNRGFITDNETSQRRFISGKLVTPAGSELTIINGYFPNGESRKHPVKFPNKEKFYRELVSHLETNHSPDEAVIVMGDMNISPQDADIGIGEENRKRWLRTGKCSFLPEERQWFETLSNWGLYDTFRQLHPDEDGLFSWFDYRSGGFSRDPKRGLRIDFILATQPLVNTIINAGIDYSIRAMEKPSDHCPVWAVFRDSF